MNLAMVTVLSAAFFTAPVSSAYAATPQSKEKASMDMSACHEMMMGKDGKDTRDGGKHTDGMGMKGGNMRKECMEMMGKEHAGMTGKDHAGMMGKDHAGMMGKDHAGIMGKDRPGMKGMPGQKTAMAAGSHQGTGVVKKVDAAGGKVTLQHEPIESIGWPTMTMAFGVKDKKMLEGLKPGQKVEFSFVKQGSDYVVTAIK